MTLCTTFLRIIQSRCNQCTTCRIIISNNRIVLSVLPNHHNHLQQQHQEQLHKQQRYYTQNNRNNGDNDSSNNVFKTSSSSLSMKQKNRNINRPIFGNALIIGSSGIVGTIMKQFLLQQLNMNVLGIDINHNHNNDDTNDNNDSKYDTNTTFDDTNNQQSIYKFCQIQPDISSSSSSTKDKNPLTSYTHSIVRHVHDFLTNDTQDPYLDVIIVASGGFEMDPTPYIPKQPRNKNTSDTSTDTTTTTPAAVPNIDQIIHYTTQYTQTIDNMYTKNLYPVIAASIVAQYYMNPNIIHQQSDNIHHDHDDDDDIESSHMKGTLMVVFGAMAAIQSTPTMIGYGTAKNSIHYYIQSFATYTGGNSYISNHDIYMNLKHISNPNLILSNNNTSNGDGPIHNLQDSKLIRQTGRKVNQNLPNLDHLTVIAILPTMIDTPNNRQYLLTQQQKDKQKQSDKTTDHDEQKNEQLFASTLVSPHDIVKEIGIWITTPSLRPHTGALIKVIPSTTNNKNNNNTKNNNNKTNNTARFELVR